MYLRTVVVAVEPVMTLVIPAEECSAAKVSCQLEKTSLAREQESLLLTGGLFQQKQHDKFNSVQFSKESYSIRIAQLVCTISSYNI